MARAAGSRFYYLLGDGALLEMALIRYALEQVDLDKVPRGM